MLQFLDNKVKTFFIYLFIYLSVTDRSMNMPHCLLKGAKIMHFSAGIFRQGCSVLNVLKQITYVVYYFFYFPIP